MCLQQEEYYAFKKWRAKKKQLFGGEEVGAQIPKEWEEKGIPKPSSATAPQKREDPKVSPRARAHSNPPPTKRQRESSRDTFHPKGKGELEHAPSGTYRQFPSVRVHRRSDKGYRRDPDYEYPRVSHYPRGGYRYWRHESKTMSRHPQDEYPPSSRVTSRSPSTVHASSRSEFFRAINKTRRCADRAYHWRGRSRAESRPRSRSPYYPYPRFFGKGDPYMPKGKNRRPKGQSHKPHTRMGPKKDSRRDFLGAICR